MDYGNSEEKDFSLIYDCPNELSKIPSQVRFFYLIFILKATIR